jgi:tricorn protease
MKKIILVSVLLLLAVGLCSGQTSRSPLMRNPTLSKTQIACTYAGDLWIVNRDGGEATRLTTGVGIETDPQFSPDGATIAFTGEYDGNVDVYIVPAAGGVPKRLTFHPGLRLQPQVLLRALLLL